MKKCNASLGRKRTLSRIAWLAVFMAGLAAISIFAAKRGDWERVFVPAGLRLRVGQDIFQLGYVYPPFQAGLAAIFSYWPTMMARVAWALVNAVAGGVFVLSAWRLSGGEGKSEKLNRMEVWIAVSGCAAALGFLFDAISNGQTDLLVAALLTSGWLLTRDGGVFGPALMGVAAAAKCTPMLFVPWVAWRRGWAPAVTIVIVALAVNLLPDLFFPTANGQLRVVTWVRNYFAVVLDKNYGLGTWFTAVEFNHSLSGFLKRLLPVDLLRPAWMIASAALVSVAALAMIRLRAAEKSIVAGMERFELGMILCLMLLLSPASSKPHFCVLLLPAWAVAREAMRRRDLFLLGVMVCAAVAGLVLNKDLVGATVYDAVKWWGVITLETWVLFCGCAWAHWRGVSRAHGTIRS